MRQTPLLPTLLVAASAGAVAAFLFGTRPGASARTVARDGADKSARWLRSHAPDVPARLTRIEQQIDALGDDLRRRIDGLQQQATRAVQPSFDDTPPWGLERGDLRDLPGLPGR